MSRRPACSARLAGMPAQADAGRDPPDPGGESAHKVSLAELGKPSVRPILIIGMVLAVFQQWCGINVIFNYAQEICLRRV